MTDQLNDFVPRLPLEISIQIFLHCLENDNPCPSGCPFMLKNSFRATRYARFAANRAPLLLLRVSHLWKSVALGTTALWTSMEVESRMAFNSWLSLSRQAPLDLSAKYVDCDEDVATALAARANQLHSLGLLIAHRENLQVLMDSAPFMHLKVLSIFLLVHLDDLVTLLESAPNLTHCTLAGPTGSKPASRSILHKSLEHLDVRGCSVGLKQYSSFLEAVTLPRLSSLAITSFGDLVHPLGRFLARSNTSLRKIYINDYSHNPFPEQLFSLLPDLTHLEFFDDNDHTTLSAFARRPDIFDQLSTLVVHSFKPSTQTIAAILQGRRQRLKTLALLFSDPVARTTRAFLPTLRKFVEDGVTIYAGPEENGNLL
ncbi:hypothetical protein C8F01DRAFT_1119088 [Mycena amicta]|nr:hypothetical protein C8F01DRAFT_1119088 [Mycena amicta]